MSCNFLFTLNANNMDYLLQSCLQATTNTSIQITKSDQLNKRHNKIKQKFKPHNELLFFIHFFFDQKIFYSLWMQINKDYLRQSCLQQTHQFKQQNNQLNKQHDKIKQKLKSYNELQFFIHFESKQIRIISYNLAYNKLNNSNNKNNQSNKQSKDWSP